MEQLEFKTGDNNEEYKVEVIYNNKVYEKESEAGHLSGLYYLLSWKSYPKDEITWKPVSLVYHFRKLASIFYKNHPNKSIATFPLIDLTPPMAKHITPTNINVKWKRD